VALSSQAHNRREREGEEHVGEYTSLFDLSRHDKRSCHDGSVLGPALLQRVHDEEAGRQLELYQEGCELS
jgi:hypothetical protein